MARFQIQKASPASGEFEDVFRASFSGKEEAVRMAKHWSQKNPNCAWGVRVVDTLDNSVIWED